MLKSTTPAHGKVPYCSGTIFFFLCEDNKMKKNERKSVVMQVKQD